VPVFELSLTSGYMIWHVKGAKLAIFKMYLPLGYWSGSLAECGLSILNLQIRLYSPTKPFLI